MSNYWQIATGSNQRDYAEDFFKYGIAFVGDEKHVIRISKQVELGDYVVAKRGMNILAIGEVVSRSDKHSGDPSARVDARQFFIIFEQCLAALE